MKRSKFDALVDLIDSRIALAQSYSENGGDRPRMEARRAEAEQALLEARCALNVSED